MSIRCSIPYPISTQYVSNIQIEIKKWMLIHRLVRIKMIFRCTPTVALFILNLTSIQPTLCLLLYLPFHSLYPPPSARALLSTLPCLVATRVFPTTSFTFFKMTSCASLNKRNKTRQGDTLHMHWRGGALTKSEKKQIKRKRKEEEGKKGSAAPSLLVSPTCEPNNSHNGPFLPLG
jgi:hypothetical protein